MIGPEQRWRWREPKTAHGLFCPNGFDVRVIDYRPAREFVTAHHYSGTYPAARLQVGIFDYVNELVGVAVFSVPASQKVIPKWCGLESYKGVELGRFVLLDEVGYNAESWFLARAFDAVRSELGDVRAILSFTDPAVWPDFGRYEPPGHVGTIYKAISSRYVGRANPKTLLIGSVSGRPVSPRALSKLRTGDSGRDYARRILEREFGPGSSDDRIYLREVRDRARRVRHPGNHAFVWPVGRGRGRRHRNRDAAAIMEGFPIALTPPKEVDVVDLRNVTA